MSTVTPAQVKAAFNVAVAVTQAIHDAGEIPSGTLYAMLADKLKLDLPGYEALMRRIKGSGLVEETPGHLLRWVGPRVPKGGA